MHGTARSLVAAPIALLLGMISTASAVASQDPFTRRDYSVYLAGRNLDPGQITQVTNGVEHVIHYAGSHVHITSICYAAFALRPPGATTGPSGWVWCGPRAVVPGPFRIWLATSEFERQEVFRSDRDDFRQVRIGAADGQLYYSVAFGSGKDGRIYRLDRGGKNPHLYATIRLSDIGGFWAGDFAFDWQGGLHVSNGNHSDAAVWGWTWQNSRPPTGKPLKELQSSGPIMGFCFYDRGRILFTNLTNNVYSALLGGPGPAVAYESPIRSTQLVDVAVRN